MKPNNSPNGDNQLQLWEVFIQEKPGDSHIHAGSLHASDPEMALQNARDVYTRRGQVNSIWVVPSESITATVPDDNKSFFEPAYDKIYRHPQFYKLPKGV